MTTTELNVNDVFDELKDQNKRLLRKNDILIGFKRLCDVIVPHLDCDLESEIIDTYQELYQRYEECDDEDNDEEVGNELKAEPFDSIQLHSNGDQNESNDHSEQEEEASDHPSDVPSDATYLIQTTADQTAEGSPRNEEFTDEAMGDHFSEEEAEDEEPKAEQSLVENSERSFICDHTGCEARFDKKQGLDRHRAVHSSARPYQCPFRGCKHKSKTLTYLVSQHMKIVHPKFYKDQKNISGGRSLTCRGCKKKFGFHLSLKLHICPQNQSDVGQPFEAQTRAKTMAKVKAKPKRAKHVFKCNFRGCKVRCKTITSLNRHKAIHSADKPFTCPMSGCDRRFRTAQQLWHNHFRRDHIDVWDKRSQMPDIPCHHCNQKFKFTLTLRQHTCQGTSAHITSLTEDGLRLKSSPEDSQPLNQNHNQENKAEQSTTSGTIGYGKRPKKCNYSGCGKSFSKPSQLERHRATHFSDRPFTCPVESCSNCYKTRDMLWANHIKTRHPEYYAQQLRKRYGLKPFGCDKCNSRFSYDLSLQRHKCRKKQIRAKHVRVDRLKYYKQRKTKFRRQFICLYCKKNFVYQTCLNKHKCPQMFNYSVVQPLNRVESPTDTPTDTPIDTQAMGEEVIPNFDNIIIKQEIIEASEDNGPTIEHGETSQSEIEVIDLVSSDEEDENEERKESEVIEQEEQPEQEQITKKVIYPLTGTGNAGTKKAKHSKFFKCDHKGCGSQFVNIQRLNRHKFSHSTKKQFSCPVSGCGKKFKTVDTLFSKHIKKEHPDYYKKKKRKGKRNFSCDKCGQTFKHPETLMAHSCPQNPSVISNDPESLQTIDEEVEQPDDSHQTHKKSPYKCDFNGCGKVMRDKCQWSRHRAGHYPERPYRCPIQGCGKLYKTHDMLWSSHIRHCHPEHMKPSVEPIVCDHCNKHFKYELSYEIHDCRRKAKGDPIIVSNRPQIETMRPKHNKLAKEQIKERPYKCPFIGCGAGFKYKQNMYRHKRNHSSNKVFHCPMNGCDKKYKNRDNLWSRHIRQDHSEHYEEMKKKRVVLQKSCRYCSRKFVKMTWLEHHMTVCSQRPTHETNSVENPESIDRNTDPSDELFDCSACGQEFDTHDSLVEHKRVVHRIFVAVPKVKPIIIKVNSSKTNEKGKGKAKRKTKPKGKKSGVSQISKPFILFCNKFRAFVKEQILIQTGRVATQQEIAKQLGAQWHKLTEDHKDMFRDKYRRLSDANKAVVTNADTTGPQLETDANLN